MLFSLFFYVWRLCISLLFPLMQTFKCIRNNDRPGCKYWLIYWLVLSSFISLEPIIDLIIGLWFPFYDQIKLLWIIWLYLPATRGAEIIFTNYLVPLVNSNEKFLYKKINVLKSYLFSLFENLFSILLNSIKNLFIETNAQNLTGFINKLYQSYNETKLTNDMLYPTYLDDPPLPILQNDFISNDSSKHNLSDGLYDHSYVPYEHNYSKKYSTLLINDSKESSRSNHPITYRRTRNKTKNYKDES